jgi:hypothetical protein
MKTVDFLDAVKARHRLSSDYKLGKFLGWTAQRVSVYRNGRRELDDDACVQIATALDLPAPYVMACVAAARAKSADIKKHWLAAARLLKTGTAAVILATAGLLPQNAPSASSVQASALTKPCTHYAHRRRRGAPWRIRRRRRRVSRRVIVSTDNRPAAA